ncbi:leucine-rich repeat domain-containing protein [Skeletonema marinoi]|uniref:Leucine-rich repeat domain-containing protein n=1 Tax=Skeletonema marinoi TaxID=267567 RepID=A0AAD9D9L8_9STRA|nr:leucine-rich repeat domain-containing protein [Skeletonema marinoi]
MAEGGIDIFVYLGGDQEVPLNVVRVVIDRSVKIIPARAFEKRRVLVSVKFHDGVEVIEKYAFRGCKSLRRLKLIGVREVGFLAFCVCSALTEVEFSDKLETIRRKAFGYCESLQTIKMPSVRTIEEEAFDNCIALTDVELLDVERIRMLAFYKCLALRRIAVPLRDNMFAPGAFNYCINLTTVDLVGGIRITVTSLLLQVWRDEMNQEIDRINQVLPRFHEINRINRVLPITDDNEKTAAIQEWIRTVLRRMKHYRNEHHALLKEATTLLELAVWKAKLDEKEDGSIEERAEKAKIDTAGARKERHITSGANIVIRNVLPFLQLEE